MEIRAVLPARPQRSHASCVFINVMAPGKIAKETDATKNRIVIHGLLCPATK
jgi:hypothetical protein